MSCLVDVGKKRDVESLKEQVYGQFGQVNLLMNNAATRSRGTGVITMASGVCRSI